MRILRFASLAPLALGIAACVPRAAAPPPAPQAPPPAPAPAPTPTPSPVPTDWMDAPQTAGDWTYADRAASFGTPGAPRLVMTCSPAGTVDLVVLGATAELFTIRTETVDRTVAARSTAQPPQATASLAARDPLLDAIAFSKGRFAVEAGNRALYVPAWPEVSRVIEDCR